jgi:hypothetical protein
VTFAEFRDRRKIFDIEGYSRQQFKAEVIPGLEPTARSQTPRGDFGGRGRSGGFEGRDYASRDRRFGGPARGVATTAVVSVVVLRPWRSCFRGGEGFAPREDRGFAPRRDNEGYGRKPGFGDNAPRGFAPRGDMGAPVVQTVAILLPASLRLRLQAASRLRPTMRASVLHAQLADTLPSA